MAGFVALVLFGPAGFVPCLIDALVQNIAVIYVQQPCRHFAGMFRIYRP